MDPIYQAILEFTNEVAQSRWWDNPNAPTQGGIKGVGCRVNNPTSMGEFRVSQLGEYYLSITDAYEDAFDDDWLPYQIIGLELPSAKEFITLVHSTISQHGLIGAENHLRECYTRLTQRHTLLGPQPLRGEAFGGKILW